MQRQQEIVLRNEYIKNLNGFLTTAKNFIGETLQKLSWTESETLIKGETKPLVSCPLNPSHCIVSGNLDKHVVTCQWHQQGYRDDDVPLPPAPTNVPMSSVVIDKILQRDIILEATRKDPLLKIGEIVQDREVPQTSDRYFSSFTTDERRILYDYVISKTAGVMPQLKEFNLTMKPEGQSAPMTREQLMAAERDAKRRRVKHRSAKVHTKSKNYSEVLREVINNQMVAYEDWIKEHFGNANMLESKEPEKKSAEEAKQETQEMVWLDWDFRSNPHTRWKHILEKEKRQKERGEKVVERSERNCEKERKGKYYERKSDRDKSSSRGYHHREEYKKSENEDKLRRSKYHHKELHSERRGNELGRDGYRRANELGRKDSYHSRYKDKYGQEHLKTERYKMDRHEKDYNSKYRVKDDSKYGLTKTELGKRNEHSRYEGNDKSSNRHDKHDEYQELCRGVRIKEEDVEDCHSHSYNFSNKSDDGVKLKREEDSESTITDDESDSSQSSSSRDSRRAKKRKKSKKKHKHKHKKKHRKEH